jgi:membrane-bound lytic murein transglycosylase C
VLATTPSAYVAELDSGVADLQGEYRRAVRDAEEELGRYLHHTEADFVRWCRQQQRELERFRRRITSTWGSFWEPSGKRWVEYGSDSSSVSVVDFETGVVTVEVLVSRDEPVDEARSALEGAVKRAVTSTGSPRLVPVESSEHGRGYSILAGQVMDIDGTPLDSSGDVARFVDSLLGTPGKTTFESTPSASRKKVRMHFELVPDHVKRRMSPYIPFVRKYCRRYKLRMPRVLATIHTESFFNPMARSTRNAIGLMQLVPHTGGKEAYRAVYGKEIVPTVAYLCDPERNIELGCAYIYLLKNRYFGSIKDPDSQLYCSIAAYNTGPGNVAYAFTGTRAIDAATRVINTMENAESVYNHMIGSLPFTETRRYLALVIERMGMYGSR